VPCLRCQPNKSQYAFGQGNLRVHLRHAGAVVVSSLRAGFFVASFATFLTAFCEVE
jgi:hypothetical protein